MLRCHVYCRWCSSLLPLLFLFLLAKTKTVYLPPAEEKRVKRPSWRHWKARSQQRAEAIKKKDPGKSSTTYRETDRPPPQLFTPSQRELKYRCVYIDGFVNQRGRAEKTKSEALALYVSNGALGTFVVNARGLKMFPSHRPSSFTNQQNKCLTTQTWLLSLFNHCLLQDFLLKGGISYKHLIRSLLLLFNVCLATCERSFGPGSRTCKLVKSRIGLNTAVTLFVIWMCSSLVVGKTKITRPNGFTRRSLCGDRWSDSCVTWGCVLLYHTAFMCSHWYEVFSSRPPVWFCHLHHEKRVRIHTLLCRSAQDGFTPEPTPANKLTPPPRLIFSTSAHVALSCSLKCFYFVYFVSFFFFRLFMYICSSCIFL